MQQIQHQKNNRELWELVAAVALAVLAVVAFVRCSPAELQDARSAVSEADEVRRALCAVVDSIPDDDNGHIGAVRNICEHAESTEADIRAALRRCLDGEAE